MKRCFTDLEANGLLDTVSLFYCAVILDEDETVHKFRDVYSYLKKLEEYDEIVFHNGIGYDFYALEILAKRDLSWLKGRMRDTLVMARLIYSDIKTIDFAKSKEHGRSYPLQTFLFGRHSLKAWGLRLGAMKGDFDPKDYLDTEGKPCTWENVGFSQDMLDYNVQDCVVTKKIWDLMIKKNYSQQAIDLEHDIAWLMKQQELNGFRIDIPKAQELYAELCGIKSRLKFELQETFGSWWEANGTTCPKRTISYQEVIRGDLTEGAKYTKLKRVTFNPASRTHIAKCFKEMYGWIPHQFTDKGEVQVDAEVLEKLKYKEAPMLKEFFDINKMVGMVGDGKNAWLRLEKDGYIHGSVNPNGASTGRATHSRPNVAQVPKGPIGSYGNRCRQLYTVPDGWCLLGTDASGLELRCLANRLAPYDKGAYSEVVLNGDVHWHNTIALGLVKGGTVRDKHNEEHEAARNIAKTWVYGYLYGAGDELLGETAGYSESERDAWRASGSHIPVINQLKRRNEVVTPERICHILKGNQLRTAFQKAIPALEKFQKHCKKMHKENKGVVGLDGRFIATKSAHSATNFQLQGDGALVCKLWAVTVNNMLLEKGLKHGWDGDYALNAFVHDELCVACRTGDIAKIVGDTAKEAMRKVEGVFKFRCSLDADYDIGNNWSEVH